MGLWMYWPLRLLVSSGKYRVDKNKYEIMDRMQKMMLNIFGHITNLIVGKKFGIIKKTCRKCRKSDAKVRKGMLAAGATWFVNSLSGLNYD